MKIGTMARFATLGLLYLGMAFAGTPFPAYGIYFGGGVQENGIAVTTDDQGNVIVVGTTTSQSLPGTSNAFSTHESPRLSEQPEYFCCKI